MLGVPRLGETLWLELFLLHPDSVTVQATLNKGDYWLNSRQTLLTNSFPELDGLNPESSEEEYMLYVAALEEELKNMSFILDNQF